MAITDVMLFDSESKQVLKNKTILINADTIAAVINNGRKILAKELIEGNGRLASPGFIDTHIHLTDVIGDYDLAPDYLLENSVRRYKDALAKTYLSYGITTVVDMGQPEKWLAETIKWQNNPEPGYPNIFFTGSALISDETRKPYISHVEILNNEEAKKKVQEYHDKGLNQIKLYWRLQKPEIEAVIESARSLDINMFAHVDNNVVGFNELLDLGVRNFEHASTVSNDVFVFAENGDRLTAILQKYYPGIQAYMAFALEKIQLVEDIPELRKRRNLLLSKMIEKDASLSTTIHLFGSFCGRTYFNSFLTDFYRNENPELNPDQQKRLNKAFDTYMAYVKAAHEKGLKLRIGTDCKEGGKAALSEMLLLHEAGIPMEDILQIANINGAQAMQISNNFGSIKQGKQADLIIFHKNPFKAPKNLLSPKTIIKSGQKFN
ncbi:amidohydrolase family protein [Anseongella ginsenosidimutans]|uniref:amidohydrolase family protein n=1 Tax=Anseongella ginsenosidimutans TaxID=496056 RepID=UPI001CEF92FD|nr:amidohydrolase family protein [Anseongella ginsenosidimutans]